MTEFPVQAEQSQSYADIVWRQFKQNRFAHLALWVLAPLFLIAILAPLVASNQPLVYWDGKEYLFPWFRALFHPEQTVDFAFNMGLLALLPWIPAAALCNLLWKRRRVPGPRRLFRAVVLYALLAGVFMLLFYPRQTRWLPGLGPDNRYWSTIFTKEEFRSPDARGWYVLVPFGPIEQDLRCIFKSPMFRKPATDWQDCNDGFPHLLGTDNTGRDVLTLMIYGTRISMTVGFVAVGIYLTIGCVVGAMAGYFGGNLDALISRLIEVVLLFPSFFLILTLVGMLEPSIYIIMFVIGITGWPTIARLIRGEVLRQRGNDYAVAARALGASHARVIFRHILPNSLAPALVAAPFGIAGAIITEAGLSLLGFGVRPPTPSWGTLLRLGSGNYNYWWLVVVPSLAIFVTVTVFNLVGSGLRDAMDPRLRQAATQG